MKKALNILMLLVGRIPLWALLMALITREGFTFAAFIPLFLAAALAKGYLYAYEYDKGQITSMFRSLWRYILRPLLFVIFGEIAFFGLLYALLAGNTTDFVILFTVFALFILSYALGIFIKKPVRSNKNSLLKRGFLLRATIVLLWLYFVLQPDGWVAAGCSLFIIYTLEYASVFATLPQRQTL